MSAYEPPIENVPEFDVLLFRQDDTPLTIGSASKLFLRYPNAQGEENLAKTNVSGLLTANGGMDVDTIDGITDTTANLYTTQVTGALNIGTEWTRTGTIQIGGTQSTGAGRTINIGTTASVGNCTVRLAGSDISIGSANSSSVNINPNTSGSGTLNLGQNMGAGGTINLGTNATRSATINIGNGASATGAINIGTTSNTDLNISGKTINVSGGGGFPININTTGITLVQGTAGTNIRSSSNTMNIADNNTSGTVNIATSDTRSGVLNIGTGLNRTLAADINIGTGANNAGHLHLQDGNNNSGNIHIANGTFNTGNVNIANGNGTGSGAGQQNTGSVNILTGAFNTGDCNISTSATGVGDVVIGNSSNTTGKTFLDSFNIDIGDNGATSSVITLNAPLRPNYGGLLANANTMIGYIANPTANSLTAPATTVTNICNFSLDNGVWMVSATATLSNFSTTAGNFLRVSLSKTSATEDAFTRQDYASDNVGGTVYCKASGMFQCTGATTIYYTMRVGTVGTVSTTAVNIQAVRIA